MNQFLQDVVEGLSAQQKYLQSKYFYDAAGDELFQQIMQCSEYYLTRCEMEIFTRQKEDIATTLAGDLTSFDVVELGAGDATKSVHLLKELVKQQVDFTYFPVDISTNVISNLQVNLPKQIAGIDVKGLNGEYFNMLEKAKTLSDKIKVVLFLGSNIGNIPIEENVSFCRELRSHLLPGDIVFIGFDLQKNPSTILAAYDDAQGITKAFNLNLLSRINSELGGTFQLEKFIHYPTYDPGTGACKSYLVSTADQRVEVADHAFHFNKYETIFMEVSQKYTLAQVNNMANSSGFQPVHHYFDEKEWFVDAVWKCI